MLLTENLKTDVLKYFHARDFDLAEKKAQFLVGKGFSDPWLCNILAVIFAYLIRGNFIAALTGTVIGNPLTFPIIWGLIYKVGTFVTNIKLQKITNEINFDMIVDQTYEIFFPMLAGGIIIAPLVWIITYYVIYSFIASYKKRKNKKNKRLL